MQVCEVVYENGTFRPVVPVRLPEGTHAQVLISDTPAKPHSGRELAALAGSLPDEDYREIIEAVESGCEQINPDDWK